MRYLNYLNILSVSTVLTVLTVQTELTELNYFTQTLLVVLVANITSVLAYLKTNGFIFYVIEFKLHEQICSPKKSVIKTLPLTLPIQSLPLSAYVATSF